MLYFFFVVFLLLFFLFLKSYLIDKNYVSYPFFPNIPEVTCWRYLGSLFGCNSSDTLRFIPSSSNKISLNFTENSIVRHHTTAINFYFYYALSLNYFYVWWYCLETKQIILKNETFKFNVFYLNTIDESKWLWNEYPLFFRQILKFSTH